MQGGKHHAANPGRFGNRRRRTVRGGFASAAVVDVHASAGYSAAYAPPGPAGAATVDRPAPAVPSTLDNAIGTAATLSPGGATVAGDLADVMLPASVDLDRYHKPLTVTARGSGVIYSSERT